MGVLPDFDISLSSLEFCLGVLPRLRNCLDLSKMNVAIGRREGRQADDDVKGTSVSYLSFHIYIRPHEPTQITNNTRRTTGKNAIY